MKSLILIAVVLAQAPLAAGQAHRPQQTTGFAVYDGMSYAQKPDLAPYGVKAITVIYAASLWKSSKDWSALPDVTMVDTIAKQAGATTGIAAIDIESWQITGPPAQASIQKYESTLQLFKRSEPSLRIGFYGFPIRDCAAPIAGSESPRYKGWQALNDRLTGIAQLSDILFPSLYTFHMDQEAWRVCSIAHIQEARRMGHGKLVFVFLWPQFYQQGKVIDYLPADYWRMELETARQYADGVVIWGGTGQTWDPDAAWWLETRSFMKRSAAAPDRMTGRKPWPAN